MPPIASIQLARWEVMWVIVHKGKKHIKVIECDQNLPEAMRIYNLAKQGGRKMVTLRCKNVGFPPPPKYIDDEILTIRKGKHKGKRVKRQTHPPVYLHKMGALNVKGVWWCPYCMELRKFELRQGFETRTGQYVAQKGFYCQMCDIPHTNHYVSKYNPMSMRLEYSKKTRTSKSKKGKRGRR